jgi:hypothetical protein
MDKKILHLHLKDTMGNMSTLICRVQAEHHIPLETFNIMML